MDLLSIPYFCLRAMIIAVDFDGTIVDDRHAYDDLDTSLTFLPGAKEALYKLKGAGNIMVLFSARVNTWLIRDPSLDPLVIAGLRKNRSLDADWPIRLAVNVGRYKQMLAFIKAELPGVFDLVWEHSGKPSADLFIDDRAGFKPSEWPRIAEVHGKSEMFGV